MTHTLYAGRILKTSCYGQGHKYRSQGKDYSFLHLIPPLLPKLESGRIQRVCEDTEARCIGSPSIRYDQSERKRFRSERTSCELDSRSLGGQKGRLAEYERCFDDETFALRVRSFARRLRSI